MTVPVLFFFNLIAGAALAHAARMQIRTLQRPLVQSRYFQSLCFFEALIILPVGTYFYSFYPDWSWMYLVDTARAPLAFGGMALLGYPLAALLGYLVAWFAARAHADWLPRLFLGFVGAVLLGLLLVGGDQLLWLGTYRQYHANVGLDPFLESSLLPSMLVALAGVGVSFTHLLLRFVQEARLSLRAGA